MGRVGRLSWLWFAVVGCGAGAVGVEPADPDRPGTAEIEASPSLPTECSGAPPVIVDELEFIDGTARFAGGAGPILDGAAVTLRTNRSIESVEIRGHLTPAEFAETPQLGLQRAWVVREELLARGITPTRFRLVSVAARCPQPEGDAVAAERVDFRYLVVDGEPVVYDDECTRPRCLN